MNEMGTKMERTDERKKGISKGKERKKQEGRKNEGKKEMNEGRKG
jgi:hypothetical protein